MSCSTDQMAYFHSNFMLQTSHADDHNTSLPPMCTPQEFHVASLLGKRSSFSNAFEEMNNQIGDDELSDDGSQVGEKKRRLNMEQVKTLEKTFEQGNKLEPERKIQLARALGLQPRQIAIWFQNRRARWKTKQLERDYEVLKRQFDAVKGENEVLKTNNEKLQAEILALKTREPTESINLNKETEGSCSNNNNNTSTTENSSELIKLDNNNNNNNINSTTPAIDSPLLIPTTRPLFLQSSLCRPINGLVPHQFFQSPSRPEIHQGPKMDQTHHVKEESLCNVFIGMDDQTGFWPWLEQNHYN